MLSRLFLVMEKCLFSLMVRLEAMVQRVAFLHSFAEIWRQSTWLRTSAMVGGQDIRQMDDRGFACIFSDMLLGIKLEPQDGPFVSPNETVDAVVCTHRV